MMEQSPGTDIFDVVIVGAGLAGLTQGIALASHGISVTVIDREDPVRALAAGFDGRVSAIALASQRMLAAIGPWDHEIARASGKERVCQSVSISVGAVPLRKKIVLVYSVILCVVTS